MRWIVPMLFAIPLISVWCDALPAEALDSTDEAAAPVVEFDRGSWIFFDDFPPPFRTGKTHPFVLSLSPAVMDGDIKKRVISIVSFDRVARQPMVRYGETLACDSRDIIQFGRAPSYEFAPATGSWGTVESADDIDVIAIR